MARKLTEEEQLPALEKAHQNIASTLGSFYNTPMNKSQAILKVYYEASQKLDRDVQSRLQTDVSIDHMGLSRIS